MRLRFNFCSCFATCILIAAASTNADAALLTSNGLVIDCSQSLPDTCGSSSGTGTMDLTLDDVTNEFCWNINWSGMTGPATAMHFHGPALPGAGAGIRVNVGMISGLASPSVGCTTVTSAFATEIMDDLWYLNIHSTAFPGGEIRGQTANLPVDLMSFEID